MDAAVKLYDPTDPGSPGFGKQVDTKGRAPVKEGGHFLYCGTVTDDAGRPPRRALLVGSAPLVEMSVSEAWFEYLWNRAGCAT